MRDLTFKVFFVMTSEGMGRLVEYAKAGVFRRVLSSFAYKGPLEKLTATLGKEYTKKMDLFVDSGAFTVMTLGQEVNIDFYADYLKKFRDEDNFQTLHAFNLDVIPKSRDLSGEAARLEVERAAAESFNNYIYLTEKKGLDFIVPIFHYGENDQWLKRMVDAGCQYIALGGMSGKIKGSTLKKEAFSHLFERFREYNYRGKVHMLGLCMPDVLGDFPWYSVDATITKSAGYGHIYLFDEDKKDKKKVMVVSVSPIRARQGAVMAASVQDNYLVSQLKKVGIESTMDELSKNFWLRVEACFRSWTKFEDWVNQERKKTGKASVWDLYLQLEASNMFEGLDSEKT